MLDLLRLNEGMKPNLDGPDLFKNGGSENCVMKPELRLQAGAQPLQNEVLEVSALQVHLDEFQKLLRRERQ